MRLVFFLKGNCAKLLAPGCGIAQSVWSARSLLPLLTVAPASESLRISRCLPLSDSGSKLRALHTLRAVDLRPLCATALVALLCSFSATSLPGAQTNEEQQLIRIIQSNASPAEKDAACARLKRIGTSKSIP